MAFSSFKTTIGGGGNNSITSDYGTIGGGGNNSIGGFIGTISGGFSKGAPFGSWVREYPAGGLSNIILLSS